MSTTENSNTDQTIVEPQEKKVRLDLSTEREAKTDVPAIQPTVKQIRRIAKAAKRKAAKEALLPELCNDMMPSRIGFHIKEGIRYLDPYWSVYGAYAKGRWIGRQLDDVFTTEFMSHHRLYPNAAIRMGRVFINGRVMLDPGYRFRNSDRIVHLGHRHEHPILEQPEIRLIEETNRFFVVDKPPSMPVHPCGQYKVHSVIGLLRSAYKVGSLKICHRLDRTTSGVLIFAKDHATDIMVKDDILLRKVHKEYICKVDGIFPEQELVCEAPIGTLSKMMGIQYVTNDGKSCLSRFSRLSVNESKNTSLVLCNIETGRTHQIRVHLQYLGYPIVDDYYYNDDVWGSERGKGGNYGKSVDELREAVQARHSSSIWIEKQDPDYEERLRKIGENDLHEPEMIDLNDLRLDDLPKYDPICLGCNVQKRIPPLKHLRMMLHCWRYKGADWEFEAPLPDWAAELRDDSYVERLTKPLVVSESCNNEVRVPTDLIRMPVLEDSQHVAEALKESTTL